MTLKCVYEGSILSLHQKVLLNYIKKHLHKKQTKTYTRCNYSKNLVIFE